MNKKRILIIDDSIDIQGLLKALLESKGYVAHCTSNGAEALALLESMPVLPDIILVDLRMPTMDGYGFLEHAKQDAKLRNIRTILMTADNCDELHDICDEVLQKPLNIARVMAAVELSTSAAEVTPELIPQSHRSSRLWRLAPEYQK